MHNAGFPPEMIERLKAQAEDTRFVLFDDNKPAFRAFEYVHDQMKIKPFGGFVGLDMVAVDVVLTRLGIDLSPVDFEKLMLLGRFYAKELNSG